MARKPDISPTTGMPLTDEERDELIEFLERDQLVADKSRPLPPAHLGRPAHWALLVLRVFALALSAMVIYTFISHLS